MVMDVSRPDEIEFVLTIKMPLKDWREFAEQLPDKWPAYDFKSKITDMYLQATKSFYPDTTDRDIKFKGM